MKRSFLSFLLLMFSLSSVFAAESPAEVATRFRKAWREMDFTTLRTLSTPVSADFIGELESAVKAMPNSEKIQQKDNLAVIEVEAPLIPLTFSTLYLEQIDGVWKVDLAAMAGDGDETKYAVLTPLPFCSTNLKQLWIWLMIYAQETDGIAPGKDGAAGLDELRKNDTMADPVLYHCPADASRTAAQPGEVIAEANCSYVYFGGMEFDKQPLPERMPILFDKPGIAHDEIVNVVFLDGHVEQVEGEFRSVVALIEKLIVRGELTGDQAKFLREKAAGADRRLKEEKGK